MTQPYTQPVTEQIIEKKPQEIIKESSTPTFLDDVIQPSQTTPVIVMLMSPFSPPCQVMHDALSLEVSKAQGKLLFRSLNAEKNPILCQKLNIQSIPTVFSFFEGQPVDGFAGVAPDAHLKAFCQKQLQLILGTQLLLDQAKLLISNGQLDEAIACLQNILSQEPENVDALISLARCVFQQDNLPLAMDLVKQALTIIPHHTEASALQAALTLKYKSQAATSDSHTSQLLALTSADPKNIQARFDLALALYGQGDTEASTQHLLLGLNQEPTWEEGKIRHKLLEILDGLGFSHPLSISVRKEMAKILFR